MMRSTILMSALTLVGALAQAAPADFTCSDPFIVRDDAAGVYRLYHNVGVNTGGLYDLYRRPKLVVEEVRKLFKAKKEN